MAGGSYVGLDIGSNLMKVSEVRRTSKGLEVTALGLAPTPPEAYENNVIIDVEAMSKAVKDLLKQSGISTKQCISSISGQSAVVVRVIEVPKMSPAELKETMNYEVERHVPFASGGAGVITDYVAINRPEGVADGQNMEVLLAAAQQDIVDRHVEMLFKSGLKPVAIDVEPLAVGRTLLELNPNDGQQMGHTVLIVNIGASITDVGIYRDKLLCFSRTLPQGGDSFTREIAAHLQVDLATAENYKRELGEIILDQVGGQQPHFDAGMGGLAQGGGFHDFSSQTPVPTVTTDASPSGRTPFVAGSPQTPGQPSSPSGRMPFDFSTPGEAPPPAPAGGFDLTGQPAPIAGPGEPGFHEPHQAAPDFENPGQPPAEPGFFNPAAPPPPSQNLPVAVSPGGDPNREALRQQIFGAISAVLVDLAQELRRSLDYYRSRSGDAPIHEILLVGGTAKLKGLSTYLEMELGNIPTRIGDPLQNVQVTAKNYSEQRLQEVAALFPVSIGLGARDLVALPAGAGKKR